MERSPREAQAVQERRGALLQAVRRYLTLNSEYMALKGVLDELETQIRDVHCEIQERARAAFADARTTLEWEDLYWAVRRTAGEIDVLAGMAIPRPQDGSFPPSYPSS